MGRIFEKNYIHECAKPPIDVRILQYASDFSSVSIEYSDIKVGRILPNSFNVLLQLSQCIFECNNNDFH